MTTTENVAPYPTAVPESTGTNGPGRASLVVGIVIVAINVAQQLFTQFVPRIMLSPDVDYSIIRMAFGVTAVVVGVLAIVGLVLGLLGLRRVAPRAAAGAGTAIAVSSLLNVIIALLVPFVFSLMY